MKILLTPVSIFLFLLIFSINCLKSEPQEPPKTSNRTNSSHTPTSDLGQSPLRSFVPYQLKVISLVIKSRPSKDFFLKVFFQVKNLNLNVEISFTEVSLPSVIPLILIFPKSRVQPDLTLSLFSVHKNININSMHSTTINN